MRCFGIDGTGSLPSSKAWDNPLNERLRATIDLRRWSAGGLFPIQQYPDQMHLTDHVHVFHSFPQSMCLMDLDWWQCGFHAFSSGPISCETSLWFLWQTKNSTLPPARNQCGGVPYLFNRKTGKVQTPWAESNVQSNKGQSNFESARRCGDRSFCLFLPSLDWKTRSSQVDTHTHTNTANMSTASLLNVESGWFPLPGSIHPLCRMWAGLMWCGGLW